MNQIYELPELPYGYSELSPFISEEQLKIHHTKHHQGYVNGANKLFEKIDKSRKKNIDLDMKATLKELSFNIGGHVLHSLFWKNMAPEKNGGGGEPSSALAEAIKNEFGSFERFKKEFSASTGVEGSGWSTLSYDKKTDRLLIMQIEKHNTNIYPSCEILMVLDLWEHAYYLDYQNEKAKFVEGFWNVINWEEVEKRLETMVK
ncbi:superoxide dismutase [Candidatus Peregrinibacteria bacterium]|nr:superoxide dismutase [Candidatus Peregrinibacteria bacterium]